MPANAAGIFTIQAAMVVQWCKYTDLALAPIGVVVVDIIKTIAG